MRCERDNARASINWKHLTEMLQLLRLFLISPRWRLILPLVSIVAIVCHPFILALFCFWEDVSFANGGLHCFIQSGFTLEGESAEVVLHTARDGRLGHATVDQRPLLPVLLRLLRCCIWCRLLRPIRSRSSSCGIPVPVRLSSNSGVHHRGSRSVATGRRALAVHRGGSGVRVGRDGVQRPIIPIFLTIVRLLVRVKQVAAHAHLAEVGARELGIEVLGRLVGGDGRLKWWGDLLLGERVPVDRLEEGVLFQLSGVAIGAETVLGVPVQQLDVRSEQ